VAKKLVALAKAGDTSAAGVLLRYSIGRPPTLDTDALDAHELAVLSSGPSVAEVPDLCTDRVPASLVISMLRDRLLGSEAEVLTRLREKLDQTRRELAALKARFDPDADLVEFMNTPDED
jgi:hypothetical protein